MSSNYSMDILLGCIRSFSSNGACFKKGLPVSVLVLLYLDADLPFRRRLETLAVTLNGIAVCLVCTVLTFHQKSHWCRVLLSNSMRGLCGGLMFRSVLDSVLGPSRKY